MKARSIDKLLRQVEGWHRLLARDAWLPHRSWAPSGIEAFDHSQEDKWGEEKAHWTIRELH